MTTTRYYALCAGALIALIAAQGTPAYALSMQECSAQYKAAKEAGTLGGMKWNAFRKAQCGAEAAAAPAAPTQPPAPPKTAKPAAAPMSAPAATGNAVFPSAVSPKYSTESAGKARMHTCLDQYNANKTAAANGLKRVVATTANVTSG